MNCNEAQRLVDPYLDGEFGLPASLEFEAHLQDCARCAQALDGAQALRSALADGLRSYRAPAGLRQQVHAALRDQDRPDRLSWRMSWNWLGLATALASLVLVLWVGWRTGTIAPPMQADPMAASIVASHARSLMADHLTDVRSSDRHTVKPWFAGKLDFSPVVLDLANQGFPLIGGRLDYLDSRPVAALIYQHQLHTINLFTWPAAGQTDTPVNTLVQQGYNLATWVNAGMQYWAISDLSTDELQQFVALLRSAPAPVATP